MSEEPPVHSDLSFPFSCPIEVRWSDIDAMDHVNNAVLVTYLEVARTRLWERAVGLSSSAREVPFIVARVAVDFRAPIHFADLVVVQLGVSAIGRSSFTLAYRVEASGRLAAEAETVQVLYDYTAGRSLPIPDALRQRLEAFRLAAPFFPSP